MANDLNATDAERIGPAVRTIKDGRRVSAAHAFLRPAKHRPNLTIAVNTTVDRIDFEGDKAVGVQASTSRGRETYTASRETILALGSIATPKLLQLSGIGDRAELRSLGVEARVDSPNVGRRMREHRCFAIQFRLNRNVGYNRKLATPAQQALTGLQYLATHKGPLASGAYDVVGFFKTSPELDRPDAQILMAPFSAAPFEAGKELGLERQPGMQAIGYILRPDSEGQVAITSADPNAPLDIDPNFFATEHDRRTGVAIFKAMRRLFDQEPHRENPGIRDTPRPRGGIRRGHHQRGTRPGLLRLPRHRHVCHGPERRGRRRSDPAGARCGQAADHGLLGDADHGVGQPQRTRDGHGVARGGSHPVRRVARYSQAVSPSSGTSLPVSPSGLPIVLGTSVRRANRHPAPVRTHSSW